MFKDIQRRQLYGHHMFVTPWNTGSIGMDVRILDWQPYPNAFGQLGIILRPSEVSDFLASILQFTENDLWYQTIAAQQSSWWILQNGVKILQNPMCKRWKQHSRQTLKDTRRYRMGTDNWTACKLFESQTLFHSDLSPGHVCLDYFRHTSGYAWGPNCRMASRLDISASW